MPKLNEIRSDHQRLLDNLRLVQKIHTKAKMCEILGISSATWTNRMKEPWRLFSYDDFRTICLYCRIDLETLLVGELSVK